MAAPNRGDEVAALDALRGAQRLVEHADAERDEAVRQRNLAVRHAVDAGVTWSTIRAETGMSPATISKVLGRKAGGT